MSEHRTARAFASWLEEWTRNALGRPMAPGETFGRAGLTPDGALRLCADIERELGPPVDPEDLWTYPTVPELADQLARVCGPGPGGPPRPVFVFPGHGAQHPGMTRALYRTSPAYRAHLDEAAAALLRHTGMPVDELIEGGERWRNHPAYALPALFACEYSLARTLEEAGVLPVAVLGHGVGEFAAAAVAEAVPLADAARLVALYAAYLRGLAATGGMTTAHAGAAVVAELVADEPTVEVSEVNSGRSTVLAGSLAGLDRVERKLRSAGIGHGRLAAPYPFHSSMIKPILGTFEPAARRTAGGAARLPYYSSLRGQLTTEPLYAPYWAEHITSPVRFAEAALQLLGHQVPTHLVEVGPCELVTPWLVELADGEGPGCIAPCRGPATTAGALAYAVAGLLPQDAGGVSGASGDPAALLGDAEGVDEVAGVDLGDDRREVVADGAGGEVEGARDLGGGGAPGGVAQDLQFPGGERALR